MGVKEDRLEGGRESGSVSAGSVAERAATRACSAIPSWTEAANEIRVAVLAHLRASFGSALSEADREDLCQEAFAQIVKRERGGDEVREVTAFAKLVAWRDARDLLQARERAETTPADPQGWTLQSLEDRSMDPEARLIQRAELGRAIEAAERLAPAEQAVYRSRFVDELKPDETCRLLRISRPSYYRRLKAAETAVAGALRDERFAAIERDLIGAYVAGTARGRRLSRAKRLIATDPHASALAREMLALHRGAAAALPIPALEAIADPSWSERLVGGVSAVRDRVLGCEQSPTEIAAALGSSGAGRAGGVAGAGALSALGLAGGAGKVALGCLAAGAVTATCVATGVFPGFSGSGTESGETIDSPRDIAKRAPAPNPGLVKRDPAARPASPPREPDRKAADGSPGIRNDSPIEPSAPPVEQEFGVPSAAPSGGSSGDAASSSEVQQEFGP